MMMRGFFTTFLMKQRLGMFGLGKASLGLGLSAKLTIDSQTLLFVNLSLLPVSFGEIICACSLLFRILQRSGIGGA
jgi:hypothetical protein